MAGDEIASFLEDISSVTPTIPAAAVNFYLMKNGVNTSDDRVYVVYRDSFLVLPYLNVFLVFVHLQECASMS